MQSFDYFNIEKLADECNINDILLLIPKYEILYTLLKKENAKTNLTRIESQADFWNKHIADSLLITKYFSKLSKDKLNLLDIGCGAGFPAIVLAITFKNLSITAVDSIAKKTNFVQNIKNELKLDNLQVICGRGRELNRKEYMQEKFDIITARAMSETKTIYRETKKMLSDKGQYILYKTPNQANAELPVINELTNKYSMKWLQTSIFSLPLENGKRTFIFSEKNEK